MLQKCFSNVDPVAYPFYNVLSGNLDLLKTKELRNKLRREYQSSNMSKL